MVTLGQSAEAVDLFCNTLKSAKSGNVDGITYLYQHFFSCVFGYIYNNVKDYHAAEDLTSNVFEKMVENVHKVRANNEVGFRAWLLRVARITIADYYRKQKKQPVCVPLETVTENPCVTDDQGVATEAFNAITEEQRQVLSGTIILGYSTEEVGCMIGKDPSAVRRMKFRGLNAMRRILIALLILLFLAITIKVIQLSSPASSPHFIKPLDKHVVFPHQDKSPEIHSTPRQDKVPVSNVAPTIQSIIPKTTPNATSTSIATPTSTSTVTSTACVANINKICLSS